jgi:hypothetical protein
MAVSVAVNLLGAGILVLVFPFLLHSVGTTSALSIFAGTNVLAFVMVYLFVPEASSLHETSVRRKLTSNQTKGRTLEELSYTFDLPTRWHVHYRAQYVRRHVQKCWFKYISGKKIEDHEKPIPFFQWARAVYDEDRDGVEEEGVVN